MPIFARPHRADERVVRPRRASVGRWYPLVGGHAVSRRIRQVLSTSATAALLVTLANCADSPTASLTPSGPALSQGNSANAQADDDVVPGEILVGLKSDADAPGLAREH